MSRRYTSRTILSDDFEVLEYTPLPWWYATPMPEPWDYYLWHQWPSAWAEISLKVSNGVWRREGARLYATHLYKDLRDDLYDWLIVKAIEMQAEFIPDPGHPAPEKQWGAFLRRGLTLKAVGHFQDVVGSANQPSGAAAVAARRAGIPSTDMLDDLEAATGHTEARRALHGRAFEDQDPEHIVIRMEDLEEKVREIERSDLRTARSGHYTSVTTCLRNQCARPAYARGLCRTCYEAQHALQADPRESPCAIPACPRPHRSRGVCKTHYTAWSRGTLSPEHQALIEDGKRKRGPRAPSGGGTP